MKEHRSQPPKAIVAAVIFTLFLGGLASGRDDGIRKEIEAIYAKRQKAVLNKDFASLKLDEADDYTEKRKDGTVQNRQQADADTDRLSKVVKEVFSYSTQVISVEAGKDGEIIVETVETGEFDFIGPDIKTHRLKANGRERDTWIRIKGDLKIKYHEELESHVQVDGNSIS